MPDPTATAALRRRDEIDAHRLDLRVAASKFYRELRRTGLEHADARDQVERIVMKAPLDEAASNQDQRAGQSSHAHSSIGRATTWGDAVTTPTLPGVPLTEDQARELSRAAKQVTSWTERRNTLIREALAGGAGPREVARACGLNHATVININKPRGQ